MTSFTMILLLCSLSVGHEGQAKELPQFLARWKRSLCCLWLWFILVARLLEAASEAVCLTVLVLLHRPTPIRLYMCVCVFLHEGRRAASDFYNEVGRGVEVKAILRKYSYSSQIFMKNRRSR